MQKETDGKKHKGQKREESKAESSILNQSWGAKKKTVLLFPGGAA